MAKKRPSLKDYLSTGDVVVGGEPGQEKEKTEAAPKKEPAAGKSARVPAKKKAAGGDGKKPAPGPKKTQAGPKKPSPGKEAPGLSADAEALLGMLAPEDRPVWERLVAASEIAFLPLDLVERREDFRTMPRDRFTLFRLGEAGEPLFHVRTSVQIREPLACLIKWDETGRITVFR